MESVVERFLRYVTFDTQSDEESDTCPSTEKQKALAAALVEEMHGMGIQDASPAPVPGVPARQPLCSRFLCPCNGGRR